MRSMLALAVAFLLAGCGASAAPKPTSTPSPPGVTDPASRVRTNILGERIHRSYILLYVSMHNGGRKVFAPSNPTQFINEALVEPNSQGTVGVCSSDNSAGIGLQYASIPAGATHTGWLRCDYPATTHVVAVFWLSHDLGNFRT